MTDSVKAFFLLAIFILIYLVSLALGEKWKRKTCEELGGVYYFAEGKCFSKEYLIGE